MNALSSEKFWNAYENRNSHELIKFAKSTSFDFQALHPQKKMNIFHLCVTDVNVDKLKDIAEGFFKGKFANLSIREAVNSLHDEKTPLFRVCNPQNVISRVKRKGNGRTLAELFIALGADTEKKCMDKKPFRDASGNVKNAITDGLVDCFTEGEFDFVLIRLKGVDGKKHITDAVDCKENKGLLLAIEYGFKHLCDEAKVLEVIKILVKLEQDVNFSNPESGETALSLAIQYGYKDIVEHLVKNTEVSWSYNGRSVVHLAVEFNKLEILWTLLETKPGYADNRNNDGRTPLFYVKSIGAIECLCKNGADVSIEDNRRVTPLIHAKTEKLKDWMLIGSPVTSLERRGEILSKYSNKEDEQRIKDFSNDILKKFGAAAGAAANVIVPAVAALAVRALSESLRKN